MNLDKIEEDMESALSLSVDDRCKKIFAPLSDDEQIASMAKFRRICGKLKLYCKFFKAKTFEHPEGRPLRINDQTGSLVRITPCNKKYKGKTYLGLLIGDAALSSSVSIKKDSIVCEWGHYNPAILVPDLNEVIYGIESWWAVIDDKEEISDITEKEIESTWYVKIIDDMCAKEQS